LSCPFHVVIVIHSFSKDKALRGTIEEDDDEAAPYPCLKRPDSSSTFELNAKRTLP
jgi:hypothetical protein